MSLNLSTFASPASAAPCAKFTLNINAFNGNTTNLNLGRPKPKSSFVGPTPIPSQPKTVPWNPMASSHLGAGMIRPM